MNSFLKPKYKLLTFEFQNLTYIIHKILPQRHKDTENKKSYKEKRFKTNFFKSEMTMVACSK